MGAGYGAGANASMGFNAAGGIMQAGSSLIQGLAANSYYKQMASSAEAQARLGELAAERENEYTATAAAHEAAKLNSENAKIMAAQRAAFAANGITGSVTGEDLITDSLDSWSKDKAAMRYNTDVKQKETTKAARLNSINLESQAAQYRIAGKNAKTSGIVGAGAGLLNTAGMVAGQWYDYKTRYTRKTENQMPQNTGLVANPYLYA
ncbi:hypothetical protein Dip510_000826 [Elusimicrobium posterum]|uniref:hypothetical protein n=1 Tax=Elusimicrobium posterum TaxID=3116653 RepID=UPI003C751D58